MMNRKCRRTHERFWKTKIVGKGKRLVCCTKCGGVQEEFRIPPEIPAKKESA